MAAPASRSIFDRVCVALARSHNSGIRLRIRWFGFSLLRPIKNWPGCLRYFVPQMLVCGIVSVAILWVSFGLEPAPTLEASGIVTDVRPKPGQMEEIYIRAEIDGSVYQRRIRVTEGRWHTGDAIPLYYPAYDPSRITNLPPRLPKSTGTNAAGATVPSPGVRWVAGLFAMAMFLMPFQSLLILRGNRLLIKSGETTSVPPPPPPKRSIWRDDRYRWSTRR